MVDKTKAALLSSFLLPSLVDGRSSITYPPWRGETVAAQNATKSQWTYPCGNATLPSDSREPWPLTGGSLKLDLTQPWTYVLINIGFGAHVTEFNTSLSPGNKIVNETGAGTLCYNHLSLPHSSSLASAVNEGSLATLQVVTVGEWGVASYSCVNIIFTSQASLLPPNECVNSTGIQASLVSNMTYIKQTKDIGAASRPSKSAFNPGSADSIALFLIAAACFMTCSLFVGLRYVRPRMRRLFKTDNSDDEVLSDIEPLTKTAGQIHSGEKLEMMTESAIEVHTWEGLQKRTQND